MGTKIRKIKIHPTYGLDFLVTLPDIVDVKMLDLR